MLFPFAPFVFQEGLELFYFFQDDHFIDVGHHDPVDFVYIVRDFLQLGLERYHLFADLKLDFDKAQFFPQGSLYDSFEFLERISLTLNTCVTCNNPWLMIEMFNFR